MRCFVTYVVYAHKYKQCMLCPLKVWMIEAATHTNQHCGLGDQHPSVGYLALPYSRLKAASCLQGLTSRTNTTKDSERGQVRCALLCYVRAMHTCCGNCGVSLLASRAAGAMVLSLQNNRHLSPQPCTHDIHVTYTQCFLAGSCPLCTRACTTAQASLQDLSSCMCTQHTIQASHA